MGDEKLMPWHKNWLVGIDYNRVDLVKEGANTGAQIKLFKSRGGETMNLEDILRMMKPEHAAVVRKALEDKDASLAAAVEAAKAEAAEAIEKARKENDEVAPGAAEEEILKSVKDPAVKALLETQIQKTRAAEAAAAALVEKELHQRAISKAKSVGNLGVAEDQLVTIFKSLYGKDEQLCEDVFGVLEAANALVQDGGSKVFQETGSSAVSKSRVGGGAANEQDAWARIETAAAEIAKSRNISKSDAIDAAIKENPDLYRDYYLAQLG